ncbi:PAS domain-containing protein, partial [Oleiphilus sp. HI0080]
MRDEAKHDLSHPIELAKDRLFDLISSEFIVSVADINGKIVAVSDEFCRISKYSREELIGKNHAIVNSNTHPTAFFQEFWECILSGKTWRGEICNRAKDKSLYWVDSVVAPLPAENDEERLFFSIRWDITEQKQLHRDALHAKALLDRSEELSGVGTWELDLQTNELYWSNETLRIHGLEQGQTPSLDEAINYYAPEARPIVLSAVNQAMVDGSTWDFELPLITQSGERIWVRAVGSPEFEQEKPRLLYGAFQDITERKAREEELLSVFQRMKLATSSGQIGIWEYNLKTGVLSWDETMYKIYGLSPSEGNEAYELWASHLHPDDRPQAEKAVAAAINNLQDFDTEFRIIKRDGSISHLRGRAHVNRTEDGTPTNMMGVNWDVSEHRKLEETLSKQKELLHVTLESIGDAVIATDLNQRVVFLNYMAELMT